MNFILTRSNQRHLNINWEPFATSTPLKIVPSNVNIEKESQKQLQISTDSLHIIRKLQKECSSTNVTLDKPAHLKQLVIKRPRKNKSHANFDFTSSSDEDSASEKRRPVIKLSFKKQSNSLLKNEKSDEEGVKMVKNINSADNNHAVTCIKTNKCDAKGLKHNCTHKNNIKKKSQNDTVNLAPHSLNSDEEDQIFDKVKDSGHLVNDTKLSLDKKENTEKCFKSNENFKHSSLCNFKVNKSERVTKNKQRTHLYFSSGSQTSKSFQKLNFENKIVRKRRSKNIERTLNSVKKTRSKKIKNKLITPFMNESRDNAVTPCCILENKTNTSHQLFSDSREQELINILDLTSEEVSETKKSRASFLWQKENKVICNSLISPHPSNQRKLSEKQKEDKPKRRHNLAKYQMIKNISYKQLSAADAEKQFKFERNFKISKKCDEHMQEPQLLKKTKGIEVIHKGFTENYSEKNDLSCKKAEEKAKQKVVSKIGKKKEKFALNSATTINTNINNNNNNNKNNNNNNNHNNHNHNYNHHHHHNNNHSNNNIVKLSNVDEYDVGNSLDSFENITKNQKLRKPMEEGKMPAAEKPVFKLMNELSYRENEAGCSAVECWDVNAFKCGVFKLKIKSQITCRTLHKSSHLGGVLIKGNIRMKIGSRELDLNEGDMAFVPPLTEWQATNIGKCESVFYYWCGRFKI